MMKSAIRLCMLSVLMFLAAAAPCTAYAGSDQTPPTTPGGPGVSYRTCTSITLYWGSSKDDTGVRGYQVFRDGRKIVTISKTTYTNTGLTPGQTYTFYIKAYDAAGNVSGASVPVKASALPDLQPPSAPSGLSVPGSDYTWVRLSWEPSTDNTGIRSYEIYRDGKKHASTVNTSYTCKGLKPGTKYEFTVRTADVAGNYSTFSSSVSAATLPDREAPSVPAGLKAEKVTETEIGLVWNASKDNVKVQGYQIVCDGQRTGKSGDSSYTFKNLTPGKSYTFMVTAYDSSGNVSAAGKTLTVVTTADTKAPSAPSNLNAESAGGSATALSWDASSDNVKVKGYYIYRNGIKVASTTRRTYKVTNPSGFGIWVFTIKAYDLAGNISAESKAVSVLTFK